MKEATVATSRLGFQWVTFKYISLSFCARRKQRIENPKKRHSLTLTSYVLSSLIYTSSKTYKLASYLNYFPKFPPSPAFDVAGMIAASYPEKYRNNIVTDTELHSFKSKPRKNHQR
ncbi:hypothetical protein KIL84_022014 [Mauremys mutica]|uniref:Uncharacterized protein n=1 Tax=Mauremys mutica TaxID=74926 RepID=A0A9D4B3U4_9SAUR|nr:hypothetical protein KIL84_022014 [Mauremys mutica]